MKTDGVSGGRITQALIPGRTAGDLEKQELELTKISRVSTRREACHTKGSRPSDPYQPAFAAGS